MKAFRRLGIAVVLMALFVGVGTLGGFFDIYDAINRVQVNVIENDYGGETLVKIAGESKVTSWTDYYDKDLAPTIDDKKAYMYTEATDSENYLVAYALSYKSESSVEDAIKYYVDYYGESKLDTSSTGTTYISSSKDGYAVRIALKEDDSDIDIRINIEHESITN